MSYALSFSPEFFVGGESDAQAPSATPTSVRQAIGSLSAAAWCELAAAVFDVRPEDLSPERVFEQVLATSTCTNLNEPVEVWIDPQGDYRLLVFNPR